MLSLQHVARALQEKRQAFAEYEQRMGADYELARQALERLAESDADALRQALLQTSIERPGAFPTQERIAGRPIVRPFAQSWDNRQEANRWALEQLRERVTVAVDGSQITPSRDFSIPVGAVQVAWFRNPHKTVAGDYVKDLRFEALGPSDLVEEEQSAGSFPDKAINLRRFELECEVLVEQLQSLTRADRTPVCFFDGSFVLSFAAQMAPPLQERYVKSIAMILDAAEATRVPVVGYIDSSYAKDLISMLRSLHGWDDAFSVADASALAGMAWGDRTELFECRRDDQLSATPLGGYYPRVHFCYLKTTSSNPPARIEMPEWIVTEGLVEEVVDVVRAECIVGTGYPYAVETADATAVLTMQDRERFYRAFQQFIQELGIPLRYARKAASKRRRR